MPLGLLVLTLIRSRLSPATAVEAIFSYFRIVNIQNCHLSLYTVQQTPEYRSTLLYD
jgi:hypothetical protein